ncbi:Potassium transporter [Entomophthora muscae]|uniref:Potassium transporter n=1 Tax=Entomophthora muscae TaxID=34485 RepID=A0ACC2S2R8_9FUNG|nr:Potassium transporter [Entomophthora muscae]
MGNERTRWQEQSILDHKFDFVDIDQFVQNGLCARISYAIPFVMTIRTCLIFFSDIWTTFNFITNRERALNLYFGTHAQSWFPYVFYVSVLFSLLLKPYELMKALRILRSHDISCTYTNMIAHRLYVLTSYRSYCFFRSISAQRSLVDSIAFYVFFTLKGWKILALVNVPREAIKSYFLHSLNGNFENLKDRISSFSSSLILSYTTLGSLLITNILFLLSALSVLVAALLYIPLAFHIRGNLKEYCCYKVDKRISKLLLKQVRKRQASLYRGDPEKKKGLPKPTLPSLTLDVLIDKPQESLYGDTSETESSSGNTTQEASTPARSARNPQPTPQPNSMHHPFQRLTTVSSSRSNSRASSRQGYYRPPPKITIQRHKSNAGRSNLSLNSHTSE